MHHPSATATVFSCRFLHIPPLSYLPSSSPASDPPVSQPYSLTVRRADAQAVQDRPRQERRQHLGRQWQPAAGQQGAARFAACRPRAAPAPGLGRSPAPRLRVRLVSRPAAWPLARRIRESLTVYRRTEVHSSTSRRRLNLRVQHGRCQYVQACTGRRRPTRSRRCSLPPRASL
jgi:hypothetical protein